MEYRFVGRTGVKVSELVLGTMAFGGWADEAMSQQIFARARDAGINFFDCADVYNGGRSEEILGRLARGSRDELVLATKAYFPTAEGPNARGSSRYHLVRAVEASLRRLQTDRIDIFYLHRFDDFTALDETLRAIDDLVASGKILYPAASNFAAWETMKALGISERRGWARLACLQPMYNLAKRQVEVEILPMAQSEELAVFPYGPLGGGLLSGKYGIGKRPPSGRLVDVPMYTRRYDREAYFELADRFAAFAAQHGHHPVSLAIAWVSAHPGVTAPIIGPRSVEQMEPALASTQITLDEALYEAMSQLWPAPAPATDRNEEKTRDNYGDR